MSDRLLKESDVMRIAFQLPLVVNSAFIDAVKALPSADRPQGEMISVDVLREILSDVKENHRNNSEAEAVISDVWDEVVDMLKGTDNEEPT